MLSHLAAAKPTLEKKMTTNTNWEIVKQLEQNAANINCKEHFRLDGSAKTEIAKVRKTRHAVYNINYHLVWIPKTRMKILARPFDEEIRRTIKRVCAYYNWVLMELQVMPDHVHLFISAPPKYAPARVVQSLKSWTSRDLRQKFSIIRQTRYSDDLWASSYYCGTAGHVSAEAVAKYIRENSNMF